MSKDDDFKLIKTICKSCAQPMEIPVPEYYVRVIREKCECGLSSDARQAASLASTVKVIAICIFTCILGCCSVKHYYTTKAVEAASGKYKVQYLRPEEREFFNTPEYEVQPKTNGELEAEKKKEVYPDPRAPGVPRGGGNP